MSDEIQTNISRLAFKHGITLGHLNETGGRELECVLERFDAQADEIKSLRARVEVLERACRLIEADPDPNAVVECVACYRHSRLAYHALEAKP